MAIGVAAAAAALQVGNALIIHGLPLQSEMKRISQLTVCLGFFAQLSLPLYMDKETSAAIRAFNAKFATKTHLLAPPLAPFPVYAFLPSSLSARDLTWWLGSRPRPDSQ